MVSLFSKRRIYGWVSSSITSSRVSNVWGSEARLTIRLHSSSTKDNALFQELKALAQEISKHDDLYYTKAEPLLTDEEYDALVFREAEICRQNPDFVTELMDHEGIETRYGGRVGTPTGSLERGKKIHMVPMLSLDNIHTEDQLRKWIQRIQKKIIDSKELEIVTEPKLDGLSLSIRFNSSGLLQWAATRGDGIEGQDVTKAVFDIPSIPQTIPSTGSDVEVRGEVVLAKSVFEGLQGNETGGNRSFSNARNAASGILLRKDKSQKLLGDLRFFAYDAIGLNVADSKALRAKLASWHFSVPEPCVYTHLTLLENETLGFHPMMDYHTALMNHKDGTNSSLKFDDYDMDGVVHKVSSMGIRSLLGSSNRAPRWAIAHKFESQTKMTKLLGVEVQVGRTGALTPVARLEPIDIQGVTVQRATLHNFVHLQDMMGSTKVPVGTPILVRRAGEVIPQVVKRLEMEMIDNEVDFISLQAPTRCPSCSSQVVWEGLSTNETGQVARCGGPVLECTPRAISVLVHAFSRDAFDIRGLSEARIEQLREQGILKIPSDLFKLSSSCSSSKEILQQISEMPRWGSKSVSNLQHGVDKVQTDGISLGRYIYSLGIRLSGRHTSNLLASIYGDVDKFLDDVEQASISDATNSFAILQDESEETKGVGPVLIEALQSFADDKTLVEAAKSLAKAVPVKAENKPAVRNFDKAESRKPWTGWSVVFSGSIPGISRSKAEDFAIQLLGAKSTPKKISKATTLFVVGDKVGAQKRKAAEEFDIPVMDAKEFLNIVEMHQNLT